MRRVARIGVARRVYRSTEKNVVYEKIEYELRRCNPDLNVIIEIIDNNPNFDIDMQDELDIPLLHTAIKKDKYEVVEYLVNELNANIHIRDNINRTPIMYAKSSKVLIFLINNGANMYDVNNHGVNILMNAVRSDLVAIFRTLIYEYDYNIDMKDNDNTTVFHRHWCYNKEKEKIYRILVAVCKRNVLNRMRVLQEFIDIGCDNNNNDISSSIQGISYNEAKERALQVIGKNNNNEELLRRQIAIERIPPLFNTQKGSLFDNQNLVGMIFEYIDTSSLIPNEMI